MPAEVRNSHILLFFTFSHSPAERQRSRSVSERRPSGAYPISYIAFFFIFTSLPMRDSRALKSCRTWNVNSHISFDAIGKKVSRKIPYNRSQIKSQFYFIIATDGKLIIFFRKYSFPRGNEKIVAIRNNSDKLLIWIILNIVCYRVLCFFYEIGKLRIKRAGLEKTLNRENKFSNF